MSSMKPVHVLINYLHKSDRKNQILILKEIGAAIQYATLTDIKKLLSFINNCEDIEVTIKLISMFTFLCMGAENEFKETILFNTGIYRKLYNVISRGLPYKSTIALNFLTALVHFEGKDEPKRKLAHYAKNLTRLSGCLGALIHFFINKIMHIETWRALCQCLAECCRYSSINQEYCMELIPTCVEKSRQSDENILVLLFSLLQGNKLNCERFIANSGHLIFTRENLEKREYMELLGCVVDAGPELATSLRSTRLPIFLQDILLTYGPQSKIGQWCSIIMYYINSYDKSEEMNSGSSNDITNLSKCMPNLNSTGTSQNTTTFYENVMKEIYKFNNIGNVFASNSLPPTIHLQNRGVQNTLDENDSFSNGRTETISTDHTNNSNSNTKTEHNPNTNKIQNVSPVDKYCQTELENDLLEHSLEIKDDILVASSYSKCSDTLLNESMSLENIFKPQFHSTQKCASFSLFKKPKLSNNHNGNIKKFKTKILNIDLSEEKLNTKSIPSVANKIDDSECKSSEITKSFSSSIFDAINVSCSTIVNKVKNILSYPPQEDLTIDNEKSDYSFTKYIEKRDRMLNFTEREKLGVNRSLKKSRSTGSSMCETCNDTRILKSKLKNNIYLRRTVKKLKFGINSYGCDFKKLSRTLWPNEPYMTPSVLYCLYRKLILK